MRLALRLALGVSGVVLSASVPAHEYWLDPLDATPDPGGVLLADIRNGEDFRGSSFPFDPARMQRVELVGGGEIVDIEGRLGDFPAFRIPLGDAGAYLLSVATGPQPLVYDTLADFITFLEYHGASGILDRHAERALPETGIRETYYRYAKTLVHAGDVAATADSAAPDDVGNARLDTRLEIVPENDPITASAADFTLLYEGEVLEDSQVELFLRREDGRVDRQVARSDADGNVRFALEASGEYLVNAVHVVEPSGDAAQGGAQGSAQGSAPGSAPDAAEGAAEGAADGATAGMVDGADAPHWISHWASMTFERR